MKKIKLNNKGFAITSIIYSMLILAIILMTLIILTLTRKKLLFNKMRDQLLYLKEYTINYYCNVLDEEEPYDTGIMYTNASRALKKYDSTKCSNGSYFFAGWTTDKNSTDVVYKDAEIVELENVKEGDVVNLYAVWKSLKVDLNVTSATAVNNVTPSVTLTATATPGLNEIESYVFFVDNIPMEPDKIEDLTASITISNLEFDSMNFKVVVHDSVGNIAESEITEICSYLNTAGVCTLRTDEQKKVYVCSPTNRYYGLPQGCCFSVCMEEAISTCTENAQKCSANGGGSECNPQSCIDLAQYGYIDEQGDLITGCPYECQDFKVNLSVAPVSPNDFVSSSVILKATATQGENKISKYNFYANNSLIDTVTTDQLTASITTSKLIADDMNFKVIVYDTSNKTVAASVVESCSSTGQNEGVCGPNVETINTRYKCNGSNRYYKKEVECGPVACDNIESGICRAACTGAQGSCYNCKTCHIQYGCLAQFEGNC